MIGKRIPYRHGRGRKDARRTVQDLLSYLERGEPGEKVAAVFYCGVPDVDGSPRPGIDVIDDPFERAMLDQEFLRVATANELARQPVDHVIFSWKQGEQPSAKQMTELIARTLENTGLTGCYVKAACHVNTENVHLHIAVSKTDPATLRQRKVDHFHDALHKTCAEIEHRQGWQPEDDSVYTIVDGELVRRDPNDKSAKRVQGASEIEYHLGERSALSIAAEAVVRALRDPKITQLAPAERWASFHAALAAAGVQYGLRGSGAVVTVRFVDGSEEHIKASNIRLEGIRGVGHAGTSKLAKLLGEYAAPTEILVPTAVERQPDPAMSDGRKAMWKLYDQARKAARSTRGAELAELKRQQDAERRELNERKWVEIRALSARGLRGDDWKRERSLLALRHAQARAELRDRYALRRRAIGKISFVSFSDWLELQDPRLAEEHRTAQHPKPEVTGDHEPAPVKHADIRDLGFHVAAHGVQFVSKFTGDVILTDYGKRVVLESEADPANVRAMLQLSSEKWKSFRLNGDDDFKRAAVREAVRMGIENKISNPELKDTIEKEKAAWEAEKKAERARQNKDPLREEFTKYMAAVGANRYRFTVVSTSEDRKAFLIGPKLGFHDDRIPYRRLREVGGRRDAEGNRENVFVTPLSPDRVHVLVDDLTAETLASLRAAGYRPAVVLETSQDRYQAVINVPSPSAEPAVNRAVEAMLLKELNERFGDRRLRGGRRANRVPGSENVKQGRGDFVCRVTEAAGGDCAAAMKRASELAKAKEAELMMRRDPALLGLGAAATKTERAFAKHLADLAERFSPAPDRSRLDAMVAVRLRATGHQREEILAAIEALGAAARPDGGARVQEPTAYARRTVDYAFGGRGDEALRKNERYVRDWMALENEVATKEARPKIRPR